MNIGKKILFITIIGLLYLPITQDLLKVFENKELKGSFSTISKPIFSSKSWFDGDFQINYSNYLEENIGFRNPLVRIHNQVYYSFFNIAKANGVIIGKDNCLYEESYIKNYLGIDFPGEEKIRTDIEKLSLIVNKFNEKNIKFIFVLAPSKARFYSEYFPEKYNSIIKIDSYKEILSKYLKNYNLNFLDLDSYFIQNKANSEYPLYSKTGIHWSTYGVVTSIDTITKYIEHIINKDLPELIIDSLEVTNILRDTDNDIEDGLNLFFENNHSLMAYPKYHFYSDNKYKPKVGVIGDSYYWNIFGTGIASGIFSENSFYYYFSEIHYNFNKPMDKVENIDIINHLEKNEVIMFLVTEGTMHKFSYGFIENIYNKFNISTKYTLDKIEKYKTDMRNNKVWMDQIVKNAEIEGISIDEMMHKNAIWMIDNEKNNK